MLPVPSNPNRDPRALIEAIENGKIEIVKKLLSDGYDFNKWHHKDEKSGDSLLHIAVKSGNDEILKLLLEKGLNPLVVDNDNNNPLHLAAKNNNAGMVATLLQYKIDVNIPGKYANTPLHLASKNGNVVIAKSLLERGANLEATDNSKNTPMHYAIVDENIELLNYLLEKNANLGATNVVGHTPIHLAASEGQVKAVKALVEKQADFNAMALDKKTALDYAIEENHTKVIEFLREKSATSSKKTPPAMSGGGTRSAVATRGGGSRGTVSETNLEITIPGVSGSRGTVSETNREITIPGVNSTNSDYSKFSSFASALIHLANGKISDLNSINVLTKLNNIKEALNENSEKLNQEMFKNIINAQNKEGNTALHLACRNGSPVIAKLLIEAGAKVNEVNYDDIKGIHKLENGGCTPLHLCAFHGNPDVAKELIKGGADPNIGEFSNKWPALQLSSLGEDPNRHLGVLKVLLGTLEDNIAKAVEINAVDKDGITALMNCVYNSESGEGVKALLKAGADVNKQTNTKGAADFPVKDRGCSALHFAVMKNKPEAMKALLEKDPNLELENVNKETALTLAAKEGNYKAVKLLYDNGAKIPESSAEEIFKGLVFLETKEEKIKSLQDRIGSIDKKRNTALINDRIKSIINGEELGPNNTFTNDKKFIAITSDAIKSAAEKPDCKINPVYRKLIELNKIGVKNGDTDNSDKVIKAALEHPEEFKALFETASKINKVKFEDDNNPIVKADSDQEKNKILHDLKLVLNPSSQLNLDKESFYGGVEKLEKTLSAGFMKALGGKDNAKKLIDNLLDEKPSPSSSPREGKVKASQLMKIPPYWTRFY